MSSRDDDTVVDIVYRLVDAVQSGDLAQLDSVLSADERERRDRFRFPDTARVFSIAHAVKRRALSRRAGPFDGITPERWRFWCDPLDKPHVVEEQAGNPPLHFNLSHCPTAVVVAISRGAAIGVDVEDPRRAVAHEDVAARFFARPEIEMLRALDERHAAARFFELWTLKESYLKALGKGLTRPLNSVVFRFDGGNVVGLADERENREWSFVLAAVGDACTLAAAIQRRQGAATFRFHDDGAGDEGVVRVLRTSKSEDTKATRNRKRT